MGSALSHIGFRTGLSSPSSSCPPPHLRALQNSDATRTSLALGRWLIYEDSTTHQLRFAWGDRKWCLAFAPDGSIQIQQGNKLEGTSCWKGDACTSSTWCTSYQDPKQKTWYRACKFPSESLVKNRDDSIGVIAGAVAYVDRLVVQDSLSGKTIELYEDYSQYSLVKQQDDVKFSRPQLVVAYDKKPVFVIDPTSLNERVMGRENAPGMRQIGISTKLLHSFNNSSNPSYLGVLSTNGHQARAHDTRVPMSSVPKVYKPVNTTNDVVQTIQICELGLRVSKRWSMRTSLHPTRPGVLWFAYNADDSNVKIYSKAIGLDALRGDVYEKFDGDIVVSQEQFGKYVTCPPGYAVVRFCGSGKDHNCSSDKGMGRLSLSQKQRGVNPVSQILCRSLDRIVSARAPMGVPVKSDTPAPTSTWYMHNLAVRKCPSKALLTGVCVSGENADCPKVGPNGSIVDLNSRYRGAIQCSSYGNGSGAVAVSTNQSRSVQGYYTSGLAPKGTAAVGVCNGGRNASDCPGNVFGKMYYADVSLPQPTNSSASSFAKYLLSRENHPERARVRQALGAPADTVFADQRGWCNDPREKCNPALGTTLEYQPWEKRINVYETSDATKVKVVTDPNRTIWRYNGVGAEITKLSSGASSDAQSSATPNSGSLSAPPNILKQIRPGWYLGSKTGTVQAQITRFAWTAGATEATVSLSTSLRAGNYRIYNSSKQNTGFDSNYASTR